MCVGFELGIVVRGGANSGLTQEVHSRANLPWVERALCCKSTLNRRAAYNQMYLALAKPRRNKVP